MDFNLKETKFFRKEKKQIFRSLLAILLCIVLAVPSGMVGVVNVEAATVPNVTKVFLSGGAQYKVACENEYYYSVDLTDKTVKIEAYLGNADKVEIPSIIEDMPVTKLAGRSFAYVKGLTEVVIPSSIQEIGKDAFLGCPVLTTIEFKGEAPIISKQYFGSPFGLTTTEMNGACTIYVPDQYQSTYVMDTAEYEAKLEKLRTKAMSGEITWKEYFVQSNKYTKYKQSWYKFQSMIQPSSQKDESIQQKEFLSGNPGMVPTKPNQPNLTSNAVYVLGKQGDIYYSVNKNTEEVTIEAYLGNASKVELPETIAGKTVKKIASDAFTMNRTMTEVVIPATVERVSECFTNCLQLQSIVLKGNSTVLNNYLGLSTMQMRGGCTLYVPDGSYSKYHNTPGVGAVLPMSEKTETLKQDYLSGNASYKVPYKKKSNDKFYYTIDKEAKIARVELYLGDETSVSIPKELDGYPVVSVSEHAFDNQKTLLAIDYPSTIKSVNYGALRNCPMLQKITFNGACPHIDDLGLARIVRSGVCKILVPDNHIEDYGMENYVELDKQLCEKRAEFYEKHDYKGYSKWYRSWCNTEDGKLYLHYQRSGWLMYYNMVEKSGVTYCENHGQKYILKQAAKENCVNKGYTGDKYCVFCNKLVEKGKEIAAIGHDWNEGVITTAATSVAEGVKTYKCKTCGTEKTEVIPKIVVVDPTPTPTQEPTVVETQDKKKTGTYEVNSQSEKKEVAFVAPVDKKKKTVTIPATVSIGGTTYKVTTIEDNAFKGNKTITTVKVGSNVTEIGKNAFYGAKKLKSVETAKNLTKIGKNAFKGCPNLKTLKISSTKLTAKNLDKNAFSGISKKTVIKVPKKKLKAYKALFVKKGLSKKVKIQAY